MSTDVEGKIGPIPCEGTLLATDRSTIEEKTGCSASIRARPPQQQLRCLTVSGPVRNLQEAYDLALGYIAANKKKKEEGETFDRGGGEFKGSPIRLQNSMDRRAAYE